MLNVWYTNKNLIGKTYGTIKKAVFYKYRIGAYTGDRHRERVPVLMKKGEC